jgi:hypothetical protein
MARVAKARRLKRRARLVRQRAWLIKFWGPNYAVRRPQVLARMKRGEDVRVILADVFGPPLTLDAFRDPCAAPGQEATPTLDRSVVQSCVLSAPGV